jgi:hypothetical protein
MNHKITHSLANNALINFSTNTKEQQALLSEIKTHNMLGTHGSSEYWQGIYWLCMFSRHL